MFAVEPSGLAGYIALAVSAMLGLLAWQSNRTSVKATTVDAHEDNVSRGVNDLLTQYAAANTDLRAEVRSLRADMEACNALLVEVRRHASQCDDNLDTERRSRQRLESEVADLRRRVDRSEP